MAIDKDVLNQLFLYLLAARLESREPRAQRTA